MVCGESLRIAIENAEKMQMRMEAQALPIGIGDVSATDDRNIGKVSRHRAPPSPPATPAPRERPESI